MFSIKSFSLVFLFFLQATSFALSAPKVVASIKPIHSLVASVMGDIGEPSLLVGGASSPHNFSLKPSQGKLLQEADLIFWVGHELETFLEKPLETLASNGRSISLLDADGIRLLEFRDLDEFGEAEEHEEDDNNHAHDHKGAVDPHIWLDTDNAKVMVMKIRDELSRLDAENSATYAKNAEATIEKISLLDEQLVALIDPVKDMKFVVFHDGYNYFETRFGLSATAALRISPDVAPGAKNVQKIREILEGSDVGCIFSEPQFNPKLIESLVEDLDVNVGLIDPLGAQLDDGPELYSQLMRNMAFSFQTCLSVPN